MLETEYLYKQTRRSAVTVRYFGGIKLGAGGLIRAYAHSVSQALSQAVLTKKVHMKFMICVIIYVVHKYI